MTELSETDDVLDKLGWMRAMGISVASLARALPRLIG
jgi:hypothetical protein